MQQKSDASFFREWQEGLPTLTEGEQQRLQRMQAVVANLERRSVLASTIKLAIIAPWLPLYGLVTNSTNFVFLKLMFQDVPRYARSRQFVLRQDNDLERVLQILKCLAAVGEAMSDL